MSPRRHFVIMVLFLFFWESTFIQSFSIKSRAFLSSSSSPRIEDRRPKLILIGGCSGTGKSTFGMSVALDQGILKCISTDTLRSVMRSFIDVNISPALHRSSYQAAEPDGSDDPVKSWKETCVVLKHSVEELVDETIERGVSLVVEGVHLLPSNDLIEKWEQAGGVAVGIMLQVSDENAHRQLLFRRGAATGKGEAQKLKDFKRVRAIHDVMIQKAKECNWLIIEQNPRPDPLELVANRMWKGGDGISEYMSTTSLTSKAERQSGNLWQEDSPFGQLQDAVNGSEKGNDENDITSSAVDDGSS